MSRDPRVFEAIEKQAYEQNEDRIRALSSAINGLSHLMNDHMRLYDLTQAENQMVREEVIKSMIKMNLGELTREQIVNELDEIEAELESNDEDN